MTNYIKDNDKKWDNQKAWQNERGLATKELKLVQEKWSSSKVSVIEINFKNDSAQLLYERLARSEKNHAEACINILYNRNELQFDNQSLWKALENLSDKKASFANAQELNSRDLLIKVKEAVELIWTKEKLRQWGIVTSNGEITEIATEDYKLAA